MLIGKCSTEFQQISLNVMLFNNTLYGVNIYDYQRFY